MSDGIRWFTDTGEDHSAVYAQRFRDLADEGADLEGEARLVDAMLPRRARILDAGCGQGRTSAALFRRGHAVVGVDVDPVLIEEAQRVNPGPRYLLADLAQLDREQLELDPLELDPLELDQGAFDACVMAGNVITFVAPATETQVLANLRGAVQEDGFLVTGFHTERMAVADFDECAIAAGWTLEHRFATWDLRPWREDADFAVSVLRRVPRSAPR